jgi:rhamnosyltransferase
MPFEPNHPQPRISVGLLLRNGGAVFRRVLPELSAQQTPWPFEIVALDSGSRDGSDQFAAEQGARVIAYRPEGKYRFGPARDRLFDECRGEVIVTLSADVIPASSDWLVKLTRPILEGCAEATVGEQVPPPGEYAFYWDYHGSWMRSVAVRFDQAHGRVAMSCANLAIRRSVWQELRFGECEAIEDRALQVKLHQRGYRMVQVKEAVSYHGHDYTWQALRSRTESFAMGWAELGWPYTLRRLVRDLAQPSRYALPARAFLNRELRSWKELVYPLAMCFMQLRGSRMAKGKSGQLSVVSGPSPGSRLRRTTDN